jgi:hypothetical protein
MLRIFAIVFGVAFIFAGVAGFIPSFLTDGQLFGFFEVNSMHNIVHIVSGVIAIMAATSFKYTKYYFRIIGIVYILVAVLGFCRGGDLYVMHVNMADNFLHTVIGFLSLYLGFIFIRKQN